MQPNRGGDRLPVVHRNLNAAVVLAAIATLTACGNGGSLGAGMECTNVGVRVGIGLDVDSAYAAKVGQADLKACWDATCRNKHIELFPSGTTSALPCPTTGPDTACGAVVVPTGGKNGFAELPDLPAKPVDVTLTLTDSTGAQLSERTLRITPKVVHPNGPDCGGGMPQASLRVSPDGMVSERP